jgi:hypothetical protein
VFFKASEDLNLLTEEASIIKVVAGYINFEGAKYERIHDLVANARASKGDFGLYVSYSLIIIIIIYSYCIELKAMVMGIF